MPKTRIVFMHIAKTAGSSVNKILCNIYGNESITHIESNTEWENQVDKYSFISGHIKFPVLSRIVNDEKSIFITFMRDPVLHIRSHLNWVKIQTLDRRYRKFVDRNENIRLLSEGLAKVNLSKPAQIRRFLLDNIDNPECRILFNNCQSRYFINGADNRFIGPDDFSAAVANFSKFDFVGISEEFDLSMMKLFERVGIASNYSAVSENVQRYRKRIDRDAFRKELSDFIGYDCALYELVKTAFF